MNAFTPGQEGKDLRRCKVRFPGDAEGSSGDPLVVTLLAPAVIALPLFLT